jgi:predicted phage replisome organizer
MAKKYYWLKLKDDFFRDKKIKKLRKIAGGDTFTIIYLKMQLLSLKNDGALIFEGVEENFAEEVALDIDEDVDNVKVTMAFLMSNGLIEETEQDHFVMTETIKCIGSESASAERVRKHREIKKEKEEQLKLEAPKMLQCNTEVTTCNTEIDIEKREKREELENKKKDIKKKYGEYQNVKLTEKEYQSLVSDYGSSADEIITYLDEYIEMKGAKYKSCYLAIRKWVANAVLNKSNASNKYKREEVVPDWFNKNVESVKPSEEEQQEVDDLLKEYKEPDFETRRAALQERLREKYKK